MKLFILVLIISVYIFETVVSILNYRHRKTLLPESVEDIYDPEKYQSWLKYSMTNFKFGLFSQSFMTLLLILLLAFNGFGFLETWINGFMDSLFLANLLFLFVFYLVSQLVSLPFKYYRIFKIEAAFGFNKMTKKLFWIDTVKSFVLAIILGGGFLALLQLIFNRFEGDWVMFSMMSYAVMALVLVSIYFLQKYVMRWFNKISPMPEGELKSKIDELGSKLGFEVKKIFVLDASKRSTKLNAYFSGLGKQKEVVLFDTLI